MFGKALPRLGVDCDLVGTAAAAPLSREGFASVRRGPPAASRLRREAGFFALCAKALFGARRGDTQVIQVRDMVSIGLLGLLVARIKGIPYTYWMSFLMSEARIDRARARLQAGAGLRERLVLAKGLFEHWLLYRVILRWADHVFVQSDAMRDLVMREGIAVERITAVPMGVDTDALQTPPSPRRLPGWENVPLLAYLGTLDRLRDLNRVVDALALIRKEFPAARLLLIGDAPNRADVDQLLEHAAALGMADAVHATGWLPASEAWQLLAGADAAVSYFPRSMLLDTNSPTKVLEYLALSIPCLGNDNPDQRLVLETSGAGWLTGSTAADLAQAACEILRDPVRAGERAARGPAFIESHRSYRVLAADVARRYRALVR